MAQQMKHVPSLMDVVSAQMDTMESIASLVSLIKIVSITKMREYITVQFFVKYKAKLVSIRIGTISLFYQQVIWRKKKPFPILTVFRMLYNS